MAVSDLGFWRAPKQWYSYEQMSLAHRVGRNLKRLLKARGKQQIDLAKAMDYKQPSVSQILSGQKYTTVRAIEKAAIFLDVDPLEIFLENADERLPSAGQTKPDVFPVQTMQHDLPTITRTTKAAAHGAPISPDLIDLDALEERLYARLVARFAIDAEPASRAGRPHSTLPASGQKKSGHDKHSTEHR